MSTLLNILEVDGAVQRVGNGWIRTDHPWTYNHELADSLKALRRVESSQMLDWANRETCRLRYLRERLDDFEAVDCGRCDRCTGEAWETDLAPLLVAQAQELLRGTDIVIEPRKLWPSGLAEPQGRIKAELQAVPGRALARLGDGGWNPVVEQLILNAEAGEPVEIPDELLRAVAAVLKRWDWAERPRWICPMPSRRRHALVNALASGLGALGKLPVVPALEVDQSDQFQADQANSAHQVSGVWARLGITQSEIPEGPVLLLDDEINSRWTVTIAAFRLAQAGAGPVLPFGLRAR